MATRTPFLVAFREPNFGMFFAGQVASNIGTWFQSLALTLVLLEATGQAQMLSLVTVAQFTPMLLLSIPAGRLADRISPRAILLVTSAASAVVVLALSFAIADVERNLPLVFVLIAVLGSINAFERVAAQSLIHLLVEAAVLGSAVATYSMALSAARSIGPGLAGLALTSLGGPACLQINALSYAVVFVSLLFVRPRARVVPHVRDRTSLVELLRNRWLVTILIVNFLVALLALNLLIVLTSFVVVTFGGDATAVGLVHSLNAVGAIAGGIIVSSQRSYGPRLLTLSCVCMSVAFVAHAVAPSLIVVAIVSPLLGAAHGVYQGAVYAAAQSAVAPALIGRTMALITLGQFGLTPVGAIIAGAVIDNWSAAAQLMIAAAACLGAAIIVVVRSRPRGAAPPGA